MSTSEEVVYLIRTADEASKGTQAIRGEFAKLSETVTGLGGGLGGIRGKLDDLAKTGRLGRFIQDLSQGKSLVAALKGEFGGVHSEEQKVASTTSGLIGKLKDLAGWVKAGFGAAFGFNLFQSLRNGLDDLLHVIPDAFTAGTQYVQMLRDLQRETGLSAEATSTLAGVFTRLGIPLETLQRVLAMFGRNLADNEQLLNQMGIRTRAANGQQLDALTILTNLREAFNSYGASLVATGKAQELLGRTGYDLLAYLQASDTQIKGYTADLRAWGLVLDQATLDKAEQFKLQINNFQQGITGLQTSIFAALEPTVESFVNSFAAFVKAHFQEIVSFVVNVANFVMGVIAGLLGIDLTPITMAADAAKPAMLTYKEWLALQNQTPSASAKATSAIDAQTKAIDRQIAAIQARSAARHASNQREQLALSVEKALQQLDDLRGNSPFTAGLSNLEQQLALQKHAKDLSDAQQAVKDAKNNLLNFDLDAQDQKEIEALQKKKQRLQAGAAAAKAAAALETSYADYVRMFKQQADVATSASSTSMYAQINSAAQEWRDKGVAFAGDLKHGFDDLMTTLLGTSSSVYNVHDQAVRSTRSGGVLGALGSIGGAFDLLKVGAGLVAIKLGIDLVAAIRGVGGAALFALGPLGLVAAALLGLAAVITNPKQQAAADAFKAWFEQKYGRPPTRGEFEKWLSGGYPDAPAQPLPYNGIGGKAAGGPVSAGTLYQVNEQGIEYFRPNVDGDIIPAGRGGGDTIIEIMVPAVMLDGRKVTEAISRRFRISQAHAPSPLAAG